MIVPEKTEVSGLMLPEIVKLSLSESFWQVDIYETYSVVLLKE